MLLCSADSGDRHIGETFQTPFSFFFCFIAKLQRLSWIRMCDNFHDFNEKYPRRINPLLSYEKKKSLMTTRDSG